MPFRPYFRLPPLPKPEYVALKALVAGAESTQLEIVCLGIREVAGLAPEVLAAKLAAWRAQAPSETPPLVRRAAEAAEKPANP